MTSATQGSRCVGVAPIGDDAQLTFGGIGRPISSRSTQALILSPESAERSFLVRQTR